MKAITIYSDGFNANLKKLELLESHLKELNAPYIKIGADEIGDPRESLLIRNRVSIEIFGRVRVRTDIFITNSRPEDEIQVHTSVHWRANNAMTQVRIEDFISDLIIQKMLFEDEAQAG